MAGFVSKNELLDRLLGQHLPRRRRWLLFGKRWVIANPDSHSHIPPQVRTSQDVQVAVGLALHCLVAEV